MSLSCATTLAHLNASWFLEQVYYYRFGPWALGINNSHAPICVPGDLHLDSARYEVVGTGSLFCSLGNKAHENELITCADNTDMRNITQNGWTTKRKVALFLV